MTAFADVARYSKPQPSLMPDVDTTLRTIAPWRYMIQTDLTGAFYQIPLAQSSLKYCGVATPFRGIRVYTRSAMGMPGSETALEEMMCCVLGDLIQEGLQSSDKLLWDENLTFRFTSAQEYLSKHKSIVLPRPSDTLWIVTDGSVTKRGLGATLYVTRDSHLYLAGFYSAKLRKHQVTWLPCEVEALSIAAAVKHFSPFIIQSQQPTTVLTDSKPCVQALGCFCRA